MPGAFLYHCRYGDSVAIVTVLQLVLLNSYKCSIDGRGKAVYFCSAIRLRFTNHRSPMKRLFLTMLPLLIALLLPVLGQGIRAVSETKPTKGKIAAVITPATYAGRQIMVGNGGGVTGFSTTYYLFENGKLFGRRNRDTTFTFIRQQTLTNTKRIFSVAEKTCKIRTTRFDHPGNMYKFVQWRKGKLANKVTWGASDKKVSANYTKFYTSFMAMIPPTSRLN